MRFLFWSHNAGSSAVKEEVDVYVDTSAIGKGVMRLNSYDKISGAPNFIASPKYRIAKRSLLHYKVLFRWHFNSLYRE